MVKVAVTGTKELRGAISDLSEAILLDVGDVVNGTALTMQANVKKAVLRGPASGRVYEKYSPRRTHRASAPGQAPATDTGRLASSIYFNRDGLLSASVGSNLAYAAYLEYGTTSLNFAGGVGGPRPFFRPAVEAARKTFIADLEAVIRKATK